MKTFVRKPLTAALAAALLSTTPAWTRALSVNAQPPLLAKSSIPAPNVPADANPVVDSCDDSGPGTLRDAMASVTANGTIDMSELACSTITLTTGVIDFPSGTVKVLGPGRDRLTIDAGQASRVFEDPENKPNTFFYLSGVTLTGGVSDGNGGCADTAGSLYLTDVAVLNCTAHGTYATKGGGVSAGTLTLASSLVQGNQALSDAGYAYGGGVSATNLTVSTSTVDSNTAASDIGDGIGGGMFATIQAHVSNSTISNNDADAAGGIAMFSGGSGSMSIVESTVARNHGHRNIGGVFADADMVVQSSTIALNCGGDGGSYVAGLGLHTRFHLPMLQNSIVATNGFCESGDRTSAPLGAGLDISAHDVTGAIAGDHNFVGSSNIALPLDTLYGDPLLGALVDNGGPTLTLAPGTGSPLINAGADSGDAFDQRGTPFSRLVGTAVDIGAVEIQSVGATHTLANCADSGDGSLRDVAASALSGDIIDARSLGCSTITLETGAIELPQGNLTILGPGSAHLTIDAARLGRAVSHTGSGTLDIEGFALKNGQITADTAAGACLYSASNVVGRDLTFDGCAGNSLTGYCTGGALFASSASLTDARITNSGCTASGRYGSAHGGAIYVENNLYLLRATISHNAAASSGFSFGGGFVALDAATIIASTIDTNQAVEAAGGYAHSLDLENSTISGNTAELEAGGIAVGGPARVLNSTIAFNMTTIVVSPYAVGLLVAGRAEIESTVAFDNLLGASAYDVGGRFSSFFGSHNLIGASTRVLPPDTLHDDPMLVPLADNGGPTRTHALNPASPAVDAGDNGVGAFATDQRGDGFARVIGPAADIGAFELQPTSNDAIFKDGFDPSAR